MINGADPSVLFDAVVAALSNERTAMELGEEAAVAWVQTALLHLKVMGHTADAQPLLDAAGIIIDEGLSF